VSADGRVEQGAGAIALDEPPEDDLARAEGELAERTDADDGSAGAGDPTGSGGAEAGSGVPLTTELARVTGLLLVVLLPIHLVTVLLADPTDVDALLERWENQWWLLADWGFLTVGVAHCLLSLRTRVLSLGAPTAPDATCPHCGGELPAPDDGFGRVAYVLLTVVTIGLYLAASWAMLRLV
jgi:hypothetical protein